MIYLEDKKSAGRNDAVVGDASASRASRADAQYCGLADNPAKSKQRSI
jgi:hypothetical protein